jgi:hypothetical protein
MRKCVGGGLISAKSRFTADNLFWRIPRAHHLVLSGNNDTHLIGYGLGGQRAKKIREGSTRAIRDKPKTQETSDCLRAMAARTAQGHPATSLGPKRIKEATVK